MWYKEETWNEEVAKNAEQFQKLIKSFSTFYFIY
jgi:hypothetical protein